MTSAPRTINTRLTALVAVAALLGWLVLREFTAPATSDAAISESVAPRATSRSAPAASSAHAVGEPPLPSSGAIQEARLLAAASSNPFAPLGAASAPASHASAAARPAAVVAQTRPAALVPSPAAAPAPRAPALPFTVVGAISGAGAPAAGLTAFLSQRDKLLLVRAGDSIAGTYRVDSVTPERIEFTYLPLMEKQTLNLAPQ